MRAHRLFLALALVHWIIGGGCAPVEERPAPGALADLDERVFQTCVEPALLKRCSYAACHGREEMPFRLYSVGKLRVGAPASLEALLAPLAEQEHHANFMSSLGFSFRAPPEKNLLWRKALPARDGGYAHAGGAIFTGADDPAATALLDWLYGADRPCTTPQAAAGPPLDAGRTL